MIRSILRGGLVAVVIGSLGLVLGCGKGDALTPKQSGPLDPNIQRVPMNTAGGNTPGGGDTKPTGGAKASTAVNAN